MHNFYQIERDKYYYPIFKKFGEDKIYEAGFFYTTLKAITDDELYNLNILSTPINHIKKPTSNKHCILISTGSMCPAHDGHIEMMIKAKECAESNGYEVLGGYIAPDHDEYVGQKTNNYMNIFQRLDWLSQLIYSTGNSNWLSIEPWTGIYAPCALNFTDVIVRLNLYLKKFNINTEIIFVTGGDNERFCLTFQFEGKCIVVGRPGYEFKYLGSNNTMHIHNNNDMSSTKLRNNNFLKTNIVKNLKIRKDTYNPPSFLNKYYKNIYVEYLENHIDKFKKINLPIISMDSLIDSKNSIRISRVYDTYGHNLLYYYSNLNNIESNLNLNIEYYLYDDDIYTGKTMEYTKKLLNNKGIKIKDFISFNKSNKNKCEILDSRDFIAFGDNNGLCLNINGSIQRAVYALPFVDPLRRASINNPIEFSYDVWLYNYEYFKDSNDILKKYPYQIELYKQSGFTDDTLIKDICLYYLNLFEQIKKGN